jgi:ABC-2 type transport system permease protein
MADFQKLFTDPQASRQMVGSALADLETAGNTTPTAPLKKFLGELDTFLGTPLAPAGGGPGGSGWQPLEITKAAVSRERRGPSNSFEVTFPQGIVWGIIGCVMTFAIGLVSERVHGTFVRLQMAPLTRAQILGGKALACFASIVLIQCALLAIGVVAFDIRPNSVALLALACACAAAGFVGFMMMIAGLGKTEQAASGAGWAMLMPMAVLGGAMMPQFIMPAWMQTAGNLSPIKWAILGLEGAIWRNFSFGEMLLPCAILLAFGAVCFAVGVRGLREA